MKILDDSGITFGIVSPLIVPLLFCFKFVADSGSPVSILGNDVFGCLEGFSIYFLCHVKLQFITSRLSIIIDLVVNVINRRINKQL